MDTNKPLIFQNQGKKLSRRNECPVVKNGVKVFLGNTTPKVPFSKDS